MMAIASLVILSLAFLAGAAGAPTKFLGNKVRAEDAPCQALQDVSLTEPQQFTTALCANIAGSCPSRDYEVDDSLYGLVGKAGLYIDSRGVDCSSTSNQQPCVAFAFVTFPGDLQTLLNDATAGVSCRSNLTKEEAICRINEFVGIPSGEYTDQAYTAISGKITNQTANTSLNRPVDITSPTWKNLGYYYKDVIEVVFGSKWTDHCSGGEVDPKVFEELSQYTGGTSSDFTGSFADFYTKYGDVLEKLGGKCPGTLPTSSSTPDDIKAWGDNCGFSENTNSNVEFLQRLESSSLDLCSNAGVARMVLWLYGDCNQEFLGTGRNPGGAEGIVLPNQVLPKDNSALPLGSQTCPSPDF